MKHFQSSKYRQEAISMTEKNSQEEEPKV